MGDRRWISDIYVCSTVVDAIAAFSVKRCLEAHGLVGRVKETKNLMGFDEADPFMYLRGCWGVWGMV